MIGRKVKVVVNGGCGREGGCCMENGSGGGCGREVDGGEVIKRFILLGLIEYNFDMELIFFF